MADRFQLKSLPTVSDLENISDDFTGLPLG
jgi:hypothetical protein